ncbi:MAG: sulfatase-like hydrolase/transferase [Chloroflexi bacterium]|nr:sulfatase-like hydrolase/transferase [Chloroflexota bacterium]
MTARDDRPNILMIVSDQERADVLGCYGGPCRTPAIDGLAAGGVRFETCVAPSAICSPVRASFLTGLYPHGHGVLNNTHEPDALRLELAPGVVTYSELLRDAGYRLGYVGKWHVGQRSPELRGFHDVVMAPDVVAGANDQAIVEHEVELLEPVYASYPRGRLLVAGVDPRPIEATETRRDSDAAIGLLRRYRELDVPFCLRLDFEGPHHPYMPPEPYAAMYDARAIPPWPNFDDDASTKPAAQQRLIDQRGVVGWTWADWQPVVARYFGFVSFIDAEIGRVLDALDALQLGQTTVVIHTADHGDMTGSHGGQFNKGPLLYDEVCRVPLIVRDPQVQGRGVCRAPVGSLAVMPTVLDLASVPIPEGLHVSSLLPWISDPASAPAGRAAHAEYHGDEWGLYSMRMVRTETHKYVYSPHGTDELYDLEADPHELVNRVADPSYAAMRQDLRSRLRDWMIATDDPLALWAQRLL